MVWREGLGSGGGGLGSGGEAWGLERQASGLEGITLLEYPCYRVVEKDLAFHSGTPTLN